MKYNNLYAYFQLAATEQRGWGVIFCSSDCPAPNALDGQGNHRLVDIASEICYNAPAIGNI